MGKYKHLKYAIEHFSADWEYTDEEYEETFSSFVRRELEYAKEIKAELFKALSDQVFEQWFDYSRFQKSANGTYSSMSKMDAVDHIKKQYQKLFQKESKAQELFDHMGETRFRELFGDDIQTVDDFIDDVVSDLSNSDLYGFIKVK